MKFFSLLAYLLFFNSAQAATFPEELIVKLKTKNEAFDFGKNSTVLNLFENVYVVRNKDAVSLEAKFKKDPNVLYVEKNQRAEKKPLPMPFLEKENDNKNLSSSFFNDPKVASIWSFADAQKNGISVEAAYKLYASTNTETVIVAVVDTGIDTRHEDLKENLWINTNEIPGNGIDDDENGYIDDINGINTLIRDNKGRATVDVTDTHSHGTHVSGTIAARQNNALGIAGIASNVRIMAIRAVPASSDETDIDIAEAFIYAAKNGARIINCSFGKRKNEGNRLIPDTLKYIQDTYGVLVIAAAGNDSDNIDIKPIYPASHQNENLLIVASTTENGKMSGFSNYGQLNVDVAAPGTSIYSTVPGNRYASMSGTSMASPTTTGIAAEILAHYPHLSPLQLKEVLINSVTKISTFKNKISSGGRIDLLKAMEFARTFSMKN